MCKSQSNVRLHLVVCDSRAALLQAVFPVLFPSGLGISLIAFEVKKKTQKNNNAVYGEWYRNVILATHGRISVAATVCACFFKPFFGTIYST